MAGTLELQGGTANAVLAYTGAARQLVVDTDHWQGRIMDGFAAGGFLIGGARRDTQTGTTYTVVTADQGKIITLNNAGAVAVTLPQAGSSGGAFMPAQSGFLALNLGAGIVTITPGTSTINGLASITLNQYDGARIISDGTNYLAVIGRNAASGGGGVPGGTVFALQYAATASTFGGVGPLAAGQLLIGTSATSAPIAGVITAGTGISISNSAGTITVSATAGGGGLYAPVLGTIPSQAGTGLTVSTSSGSITKGDGATGIFANCNGNGYQVLNSASVPATPYTKTALVDLIANNITGINIGIGWKDSGTKQQVVQIVVTASPSHLIVETDHYSDPSTYVGTDGGTPTLVGLSSPLFLQISDDGTNVFFRYGKDGANFIQLYTVAKASGYLGSSGYAHLMFWVTSYNSANATGTLLAWF